MKAFSLVLLFLASPSFALSLHDFLENHPSVQASVKIAYQTELKTFKLDPVYCSEKFSYPGMKDSCHRGVRDELARLARADWGSDWTLDSTRFIPGFGEVLVFKKLNILDSRASMSCVASLSIPANASHSTHLSFDIYCDH
jgi:hypothetical protein